MANKVRIKVTKKMPKCKERCVSFYVGAVMCSKVYQPL